VTFQEVSIFEEHLNAMKKGSRTKMSVDTTATSLTPLLDTAGFSGSMAGFLIGFVLVQVLEKIIL
jgi:hypothetical protein